MYLTSGFAEVTVHTRPGPGYREQLFTVGYSIAGFDPDDLILLLEAAGAFYDGLETPESFEVSGLTLRVGTVDPTAPLVYFDPSVAPGTGSTELLAPNSCFLVGKTTLLGGRKGRGRCFVPGVREDMVSDTGVIDETFRFGVQGEWDTMIAAWSAVLGGEPYLLHTTDDPAPTIIESMSVQSVIATQRRRLTRG
jgi:hypothetical protein